MIIQGSKFDIREIKNDDRAVFEKIIKQNHVFANLFDVLPTAPDFFWKNYGEANDVYSILDKCDNMVGFIHYETEEDNSQGQLELFALKGVDFRGFGKEMVPLFLKYVYEKTHTNSCYAEIQYDEDPVNLIFEEMGYDIEDGYIEIDCI